MSTPDKETYALPEWMRPWEQFWYAPADPALLGLIRISCGLIIVYTMFVYSFRLQEFQGQYGWHDLELQRERLEEAPVTTGPLVQWNEAGPLPTPKNDTQRTYVRAYRKKFGTAPPPPYPTSAEQGAYLDAFRLKHGVDLRVNGIVPSDEEWKRVYADEYTSRMRQPPPAYPESFEEAKEINDYIMRMGPDPRRLYAKGMSLFSIWFHVTDPTAMAIVHGLIIAVAVCFTIGFCTRISSALLWFASLCYIHRNPTVLFGVDTMMTILLFYLMMGPCAACYSVDRWIAQWWASAKAHVVAWWYGLLGQPGPQNLAPPDPVPDDPEPTISANVVIRLLQIHVCIIYFYAGVSKLQGQSWWNGTAIWQTLGNYEFAPMQFDLYLTFLKFLGSNQLVYDGFMTFGGLFTLAFEIGYAFLIWRPSLRWLFLAAAILLHGGIGLFMGLKTFSLMMLVLNMAFLRKEEVVWLMSVPTSLFSGGPAAATTQQTAPPAPAAPLPAAGVKAT
ncbi:MAG: hypothetical protein FJ303_07060 [Planctomycetes bacterium]|nr:hypothetical protein [Planctomycetota bacterium]